MPSGRFTTQSPVTTFSWVWKKFWVVTAPEWHVHQLGHHPLARDCVDHCIVYTTDMQGHEEFLAEDVMPPTGRPAMGDDNMDEAEVLARRHLVHQGRVRAYVNPPNRQIEILVIITRGRRHVSFQGRSHLGTINRQAGYLFLAAQLSSHSKGYAVLEYQS
jgi:hypothetical protein